MLARSRHLFLQATVLTFGLTACDNQNAAEHRAQTDVVRSATSALETAPANGPQAKSQLNAITRDLRAVRFESDILEATAQRLISEVETRIADLAWQAGATSRNNATEAAARVAGYLTSATRRQGQAGQHEAMLESLTTDQLEALRGIATQQHAAAVQQHQRQLPGLQALDAANVKAAQEVLALRVQAADLRSKANTVDGITGKQFRIEASEVEHLAAIIEADMERRAADADLNLRPVVDQLSMRSSGAAEHVTVVDGEITRIQKLAEATRARSESGRVQLAEVASQLGTEGMRLIDLLTGPTQTTFTETMTHLKQAAAAAGKARPFGKGKWSDSRTEKLIALRAEVAMFTIALERQGRLQQAIRLLGEVAAIGEVQDISSRWSETRQVLQDRLDEASTDVEESQSKAAELANSLGDDIGPALLNLLEGSADDPDQSGS
jgi:hypothetical protein